MKEAGCDLCHNPLPIIKKLYNETDRWVIIDCKSCLVPMIVWKKHTMYLEEEESKDITKALTEVADKCYEDTKLAAYRVIHDQGYTCYSIATVIREITNSIFEDKKQVFTLSVPLDNYYGNSDVCLSVPCVLGRGGVEQVLKVPLSKQEQEQLKTSCDSLKPFLN